MIKGVEAHIHLDMYEESKAREIAAELHDHHVLAIIAVSRHLASSNATKALRDHAPDRVFAAYGFHPEQQLPTEDELTALESWIIEHADEAVAIGEIGLPYYMRKEAEEQGAEFDLEPYIKVLDRMLRLAARLHKPVALHAVYEDADIVCDLLDRHGIRKAHFHWFKGSSLTLQRMMNSGFMISITPDVLYENEIQDLVRIYPIEQMMVETDGPWPFEGPFEGRETHPHMIFAVIEQIANIKHIPLQEAADRLLRNTVQFYSLPINNE
ncbi:TatD family hydrolase [Paenibacillus aestuarii]|uniref:TatD family hydrolase n=1 Tax=Paenibacillus aestuarii TaxID=516965 RepID=A0ABW0KHQ9_9BACL|nr:TatD family hydrolase [Paenibacillus aestuarii]